MDRQAWRDFFITTGLLGCAFLVALLSTVAAEQEAAKISAIAAALSLLIAGAAAFYIVPRLARRVRLDFLRFSIHTSITVEGSLFIVFLAVIAFAAWNTGNNLLYLVFSSLAAFLIAANFVARVSLADVSVQLRFPDHIFAGESAKLTVKLTNHKRVFPSFSLLVEAISDNRSREKEALGKLAHFVFVPASAGARQRVEHIFDRRGSYPINAFRISTRFPTGFFKKWRRVEATGEILVYPQPRPLDDFYHALPMLAGQISSHARGSGDDLYAIRRYLSTDHMRHIDWKATAKSMELMVRDQIREDERRLTIVLDATVRDASSGFDKKFEQAIVMAASLANHFIQEGANVELIAALKRHNVRSGSGLDHLYEILRSLATIEPVDPPDRTAAENGDIWDLLKAVPVLADERRFKVVITAMPKGSIPARVWRSAHVVFMEDL